MQSDREIEMAAMKKTARPLRQGDVLLVPVRRIPAEATAGEPVRRLLVAEGEVTGHAHVIEDCEMTEHLTVDERFVRIMEANGLLTHDEHDTITVPPGDYRIVVQREYAEEANRWVAD